MSALVVIALFGLVGWVAYLIFCHSLVKLTRDAKSLEYAARAARAYREGWAGQVARAISKLLRRPTTPS